MYPFTSLRASLHFTSLHSSALILSTFHFTFLFISIPPLPSLPLIGFHVPAPRFESTRFTMGSP